MNPLLSHIDLQLIYPSLTPWVLCVFWDEVHIKDFHYCINTRLPDETYRAETVCFFLPFFSFFWILILNSSFHKKKKKA